LEWFKKSEEEGEPQTRSQKLAAVNNSKF